ncbi:hypothetical protein [Streptomyces sp. NPDC058701]|uniref:hypothetical protein n=1 Tax=Streptomyces sp. NPDC058701 TaxID=3346608 RepID=UPI003659AB74
MFKSKKARRTALIATVAVAAVTVGGIAVADGIGNPVRAPHAQASGLIYADGQVDRGTGIKSVEKGGTGIYCIRFTDPRLKVTNITPQTTPVSGSGWHVDVYAAYAATSQRGDRDDTLTVVTAQDGNYHDEAFWLLVP